MPDFSPDPHKKTSSDPLGSLDTWIQSPDVLTFSTPHTEGEESHLLGNASHQALPPVLAAFGGMSNACPSPSQQSPQTESQNRSPEV